MKIFILEDEIGQYPRQQIVEVLAEKHTLTVAKSYDEGVALFCGPYDVLLLDHDMEGNYEYRPNYPNTGHQFVKWFVQLTPQECDPQIILHSQNGVGRRNMRLLLEDFGYRPTEVPFGPTYVKLLKEQLG